MTQLDFEQRLRRELGGSTCAPSRALRERILTALDAAPDRVSSSTDPLDGPERWESVPRRYPRWITGLAAGLMILAGLHAVDVDGAADAVQVLTPVAIDAGLADDLTGTAAEMESSLLAQADLLAEDARRAAASLLDRMPAAPWGRRTDSR